MFFKTIKLVRKDLTSILFVNSKRNIFSYRISNRLNKCTIYESNKRDGKLLNKNKKQENRFYLNEPRNFVSLAWLGLWGKTPAKNIEVFLDLINFVILKI